MNSSTDRIERSIHIEAPRSKVWHAIADAETFGKWFRVNFTGQRFVVGEVACGNITYPGYEHVICQMFIDRIEPEHRLVYRWHPYAIDPGVDYTQEPTTLVVFELEDADGGTLLRITESGFDRIPLARRAEAFRMNSGGWDAQTQNIAAYLATH